MIKLLLDEMRQKQKLYKPCVKALLQAFLLQVGQQWAESGDGFRNCRLWSGFKGIELYRESLYGEFHHERAGGNVSYEYGKFSQKIP